MLRVVADANVLGRDPYIEKAIQEARERQGVLGARHRGNDRGFGIE